MGAGQPGRRHRHRRLRVRPGRDRSRPALGTAGAARGRPRLQHDRHGGVVRRDVRAAARAAQPAAGRPARHRAAPSRSTARCSRTRTAVRRRGGRVRRPARRPRRRLHDRAVGRRPRRGDPGPAARRRWTSTATPTAPSSPRSSPAGTRSWCAAWCWTAPTRRTARTAWYADPGTGDAARVRGRLPAVARVPQRRDGVPADAGEGAGRVRSKPWRGTAYDADGRRMRVAVERPGLVDVAFGATYTPAFYRELTAALRSGLAGDRRAAAAAGGRGDRRRHRRRAGRTTARGWTRRCVPRLPAALRHDRAAGGPGGAVRRGARRAPRPTRTRTGRSPCTSTPTRPGRRSTGAPAGRRRRRQPGRSAGAAVGRLPRRPGAGAERRAGLDHHAGRGRPRRRAVPATPSTWSSPTAST